MRRFLVLGLICCAAFAVAPALASASAPNGDPIVRFATTLGNIDVQLYQYEGNGAVAATVQNFLSYVDRGSYGTTFFHRSVQPGSAGYGVIQGGGFQVQNGQRTAITTFNPINLQYVFPNQRGTIGMARGTGDNTANSQWYFNTTDNSTAFAPTSTSDGYAVFGRILSPTGLATMDSISAQQVVNDSVDGSQYQQLPAINYTGDPTQRAQPGQVTASNLIMSPITVLPSESPTVAISQPTNGELFTQGQSATPRFSCNEDSNGTGMASCTSSGFDFGSPGSKTFTVTGTDYAGDTTTKSVSYTVNAAPPGPTPTPTPTPPPKPKATPLRRR